MQTTTDSVKIVYKENKNAPKERPHFCIVTDYEEIPIAWQEEVEPIRKYKNGQPTEEFHKPRSVLHRLLTVATQIMDLYRQETISIGNKYFSKDDFIVLSLGAIHYFLGEEQSFGEEVI